MSKFTSENWHSGPLGLPAYVQMGEQGGFQLKRSDSKNHEAANLISAAPDMYDASDDLVQPVLTAINMLRRGGPAQNEIADELALKIGAMKDALAKADGKGE